MPTDWILYDSNRCDLPATTCIAAKNWELYAQDPSGNVYQLTEDPFYDSWWPKLSPDRTKIMFMRNDAGTKENDWNKSSLWVLPVDGASFTVKKLLGSGAGRAAPSAMGWNFLAHPEWDPQDGHDRIAVIGRTAAPGSETQIYVIPYAESTNSLTTSSAFRVTHGANVSTPRPGLTIDPSWHPDGNSILFSGCTLNQSRTACAGTPGLEIFLTSVAPSPWIEVPYSTPGSNLRYDAYFNPSGDQVAWLHQNHCSRWSIYHGKANVLNPMSDVSPIVDDGAVNSKPAWSPDGSRVYFHKYSSIEQTIWSVPAAGGTATQLSTAGAINERCSLAGPSLDSGPHNAAAGPNPLPPDSIVYASNRCLNVPASSCTSAGQWHIYTQASGSTSPTRLTPDAAYVSFAPVLSPNRTQVLFLRAPLGQGADSTSFSLWVIDAVGTSTPVELVPSGVFARLNNPAWSPNNDGIAFDASTAQQEAAGLPNGSNQIYAVGYSQATRTLTTGAMQLTWGPNQTGDRPGNNVHPAWFHDGQSIIFSGCTPNATRTACDAAYTGADIRLISFPSKTVDVAITSTSPTVGVWYNSALDPHADYIAATLQTSCSATKIMRISLSNGAQTTLFSAASTLVDNAAWSSDSSKVYFDRLPATIGPTIWTTTVGTPPATSPAPTEVMLAGNVPIPCGSGFPNAGAH